MKNMLARVFSFAVIVLFGVVVEEEMEPGLGLPCMTTVVCLIQLIRYAD
jgi:hypothetical protein